MRTTLLHGAALVLFGAAAVAAQGTGGVNAPGQRAKPIVVLVSFDGLRPEYLKRIDLPNFERAAALGVRAEGMLPTFPSKTFPNHYAIVTGMYAGHHGLVGNSFWDPQRNAGYRYTDTLTNRDATWYRGEPIWVTAEKQGLVAASFFWPGSEAPIGGVRPSRYKAYDGRVPNFARVDTVLSWLALPEPTRPHLLTLYFSDVDHAGHESGPLSAAVDTATRDVDAALGRLMQGIDRLPDHDRIYLVLVSDHGMMEQGPRWYAGLDTIIDLKGVRIADAGPNANLHVQGGIERARVLRDSINRRMRHGHAYLRAEVPARLHYSDDPRIGDMVVIMDDHYTVGTTNRAPKEGSGTHGWEPVNPDMYAFFIATGRGIPAGRTIPVFENVQVYPWLAELLGIAPAKDIDGKPGLLAKLISDAK